MRVLIIGINYRPELAAIGPYSAGLAEHLAARGDHLAVLTGPVSYPGCRLMRGTRGRVLAAGRFPARGEEVGPRPPEARRSRDELPEGEIRPGTDGGSRRCA